MNEFKIVSSEAADEPFEDLAPSERAAAGQARARREGNEFDQLAFEYVKGAGATIAATGLRIDGQVTVDARLVGANGQSFWMLGHGNLDDTGDKPGLQRTDTVLKTIGAAYILSRKLDRLPVLLVTSHLPKPTSAAGRQLSAAASLFFDVIATTGDLEGFHRLQNHFCVAPPVAPLNAPWMTSGDRPRSTSPKRTRPVGQMSLTSEGDDDA
ncbi:MAG: hypothetical protein Q7V57_18485 [Actinomycetota bacterium]|nr:hypothetical protein [Actinomycetota bacterium]